MTNHTRRAGLIAVVLAATLLLSACQNLPRRVAGARCKLVGEHAQDGTWVLKCGANKRWNRLMTIDAANGAVASWLRSQAPAPTSPPTTVPGPDTSFGDTTGVTVAERAGSVKAGVYITRPGATYCRIEIIGTPSRLRVGRDGPMYFALSNGDFFRTSGGCRWSLGLPGPQTMPANGNGMYRVNTEIGTGLFTAPGGASCYWETATSSDGSIATITDNHFGDGPQLAQIDSTDAFFVSDGCGAWTPLTTAPSRFLEVASSFDNYPLQGHRAFYQGSQFTVTATAATTAISTPAFTATIAPPAGGPFTNGTFTVSRWPIPAPGNVLVDVTSPGRGCNIISGTATVSEVVLDVDGAATSMHIVVLGECDSEPFGLNLRY